jgi:hypothetical protein
MNSPWTDGSRHGRTPVSRSGSLFESLLIQYPNIETQILIIARRRNRAEKVKLKILLQKFETICRAEGLGDNEYHLCCISRGSRACDAGIAKSLLQSKCTSLHQ